MRRAWAAIVMLGVVLAAGPSLADDHEGAEADARLDRAGFYIMLGGHAAIENFDDADFHDSASIDVRTGYRLNPLIAVETHLEWIEDFDSRNKEQNPPFNANQPVGDPAFLDAFTATVNARIFLPLEKYQDFQPYGLLGGGLMRVGRVGTDGPSEHDVGYAGRLGAGVDMYLTQRLGVNLEVTYVIPTGTVADFQYTSVGASFLYRF